MCNSHLLVSAQLQLRVANTLPPSPQQTANLSSWGLSIDLLTYSQTDHWRRCILLKSLVLPLVHLSRYCPVTNDDITWQRHIDHSSTRPYSACCYVLLIARIKDNETLYGMLLWAYQLSDFHGPPCTIVVLTYQQPSYSVAHVVVTWSRERYSGA